MRRRTFVQRAAWLVTGCAVVPLTGCGTILHSDRVGGHHSRDIDWKIAGLNGLGLAFFFVPGVIAFVVDFYTGAIYLPPQRSASDSGSESKSEHLATWERMEVGTHRLTREPLERILSERSGRDCQLSQTGTRVSILESGDQIAAHRRRHQSDPAYGVSAEVVFEQTGRTTNA